MVSHGRERVGTNKRKANSAPWKHIQVSRFGIWLCPPSVVECAGGQAPGDMLQGAGEQVSVLKAMEQALLVAGERRPQGELWPETGPARAADSATDHAA